MLPLYAVVDFQTLFPFGSKRPGRSYNLVAYRLFLDIFVIMTGIDGNNRRSKKSVSQSQALLEA